MAEMAYGLIRLDEIDSLFKIVLSGSNNKSKDSNVISNLGNLDILGRTSRVIFIN